MVCSCSSLVGATARHFDGRRVRQELAAGVQSRRIPIVIVTASASVPKNIDVACVLTKPVAAHELLQTVRGLLQTVVALLRLVLVALKEGVMAAFRPIGEGLGSLAGKAVGAVAS